MFADADRRAARAAGGGRRRSARSAMADRRASSTAATGTVTLQPGKPVTVGFLLSDDSVGRRCAIVVQDPATDAELYRSPADIPVRLGVG